MRYFFFPLHTSLTLLLGLSAVVTCSSTIDLGYAKYVGTPLEAGVTQFLGMRYAAPPLADRRWRAPADPLKEEHPVEATTHGPLCYAINAAYDASGKSFSEDCLFIDVYTPSNASKTSKLPVWFFIQGGGYVQNSNANYNGTGVILESKSNVVVVNFNYRVSAYGFLASERVAADGDLNLGLLDQRKALLWVHKYISKFGGDPKHVVIQGVSAGGGSVSHHLTAFGGRNEGLFVGAIGNSIFWPREAPLAELESQFDLFTSAAGCGDFQNQMACLRALNTSVLQAANIAHPYDGRTGNPRFYYTPTIDGNLVQDHLYTLFQQGKFISVPLLLGDDDDEGSYFADNVSTPEGVITFLANNYPQLSSDDATNITALYPLMPPVPNHAEYFPSASAAYGEGTFTCPSNFIASKLSDSGSPVWNYRFSVIQADNEAAGLGVPHTTEVVAIFGPAYVPNGNSTTFATTNAPMVPILMNYWISFIRSLDPNQHKYPGTPEWEEFDSENKKRIKFVLNDTRMDSIDDEEDGRCAFWESVGVRLEQ
ncbi:Alpha/Beta hydrolase protein [Flagelloscypha sp. PMI_526]|nr:Alpha/Beta hydrolase protein [Flagelloscypha sp. PMI_526]